MTNTRTTADTYDTEQVANLLALTGNRNARLHVLARNGGVWRELGIGSGRATYTRAEVAAIWLDHTLRAANHPTNSALDTTTEIDTLTSALNDRPDWLITGGGTVHCLGDDDLALILEVAHAGHSVRAIRLAPLHHFLETGTP